MPENLRLYLYLSVSSVPAHTPTPTLTSGCIHTIPHLFLTLHLHLSASPLSIANHLYLYYIDICNANMCRKRHAWILFISCPRVTSWLQLGNLLITMGEFYSGAETSKLRVKLDYRQQVMMGEMFFFLPKKNILNKHLGNAGARFITVFSSHV